MNMQQVMKQAQKMQRQLAEAQDALSDVEVSGTAGGGMVTVKGTADGQISAIEINGSVLGLLSNAQEVTNQRLGAITGGMGMPGMPGMF